MISRLKKILPNKKFAYDVSVLVGGTATSQFFFILASPLLTRLYTPEDFGLLAIYTSLLALLAVIASLRYEVAIPLPEDDIDAVSLVILSLLSLLSITLVTSLLILIAGDQIASALDLPILKNFFWILPIGVALSGLYNILSYWSVRQSRFTTISRTKISQTIATILIQVFGFKIGGLALLLGHSVGLGVGSYSLYKHSKWHEGVSNWTWGRLLTVAKRYRKFPIFSTWSSLFNTAGTQLPPLLLAGLFTSGAAGLYALAHRVLALPASVIGDAIGKVFFSNAAEAYRAKTLGSLVKSVYERLLEIIIPITLLLMISGPPIFSLIFGDEWRLAGTIAQYMSVWLCIVFITSPLSMVFIVIDRENTGMIFQALLLIFRVIALALGAIYFDDLILAIALFVAVSFAFWFGFLVWLFNITGNNMMDLFRPLLNPLLKSCAILSPLFFIVAVYEDDKYMLIGYLITAPLIATYYYKILKKAYL